MVFVICGFEWVEGGEICGGYLRSVYMFCIVFYLILGGFCFFLCNVVYCEVLLFCV